MSKALFATLLAILLISTRALADAPKTIATVPAGDLHKLFYMHTSTLNGRTFFWGRDARLYGVAPKAYGYYQIDWYQSPKPRQSTSSQGGGYLAPIAEASCTAYAKSGARLLNAATPADPSWQHGNSHLDGLHAGNLLQDRYDRLVAAAVH